jgi:hypothetical protein
MKNLLTNCLILTVLLFLVSGHSQAQESSRYSVGINVGTFVYSGDLSPWRTGSWKTPAFVLGLSGHKEISSTLAARLELNFGKLRGDEAKYNSPAYHQQRAFAFNNNITEVVLAAEWSPLGHARKLSPYVFGGIGYAGMKIRRDYSRFNEAYFAGEPSLKEKLDQDAATNLPKGVAIFPLGLGLKYALNNKFSLTTEAAHRFTRSDYIDGFSYSGNPKLKDSYTKYSIGLRYTFGGKDPYACPPMRY